MFKINLLMFKINYIIFKIILSMFKIANCMFKIIKRYVYNLFLNQSVLIRIDYSSKPSPTPLLLERGTGRP